MTTSSPISVTLGTDDAVFDLGIFGWMEEASGGPTGIIKGIVWNDIDGNGIKGENEPGLESASLLLAGDATATVATGADGFFTFTGLAAGDYSVFSMGPLGWTATTADKINVTLETDDAQNNELGFGWKSSN